MFPNKHKSALLTQLYSTPLITFRIISQDAFDDESINMQVVSSTIEYRHRLPSFFTFLLCVL